MRFLGLPVQHVSTDWVEAYLGTHDQSGDWVGDQEDWDRYEMSVTLPIGFRQRNAAIVRAHRRAQGHRPFITEVWQEPYLDIPVQVIRLSVDHAARVNQLRVVSSSDFVIGSGLLFNVDGQRKVYTVDKDLRGRAGTLEFSRLLYKAAIRNTLLRFVRPQGNMRYKPTGIYRENFQYGQLVSITVNLEEALGVNV